MPTIDGTNQLIILDAGISGVAKVDVERDLYSAWKTWLKLPGNAKYQLAFTGSEGGGLVTGVLESGSYFRFQNQNGWRIRPAEENGNIVLTGNLVPQDDTLPIFTNTLGSFTVFVNGIQPITQNISAEDVEHSSYDNAVTIDVVNGISGTVGTTGNKRNPVNNLTDAKTIAAQRGLNVLDIKGAMTFVSTDSLDGLTVIGISTVTTNIFTLQAGCSTMNTRFKECTVVGTLKGKIDAEGVIFGAIIDMDYASWLLDCWFEGDITLKGAGTFIIIDGGVANPPGNTSRPIFDYTNVSLAKSNFLRWSGNIGFKGVTAGNISLNIDSGKVFLEASNTGGTIMIRPEHTVIEDETPIGGMQVIGELLRFAVVADAGNTSTTFKTNLTATQTNVYKDSLIQVLPTLAASGLAGEVKSVLSYDSTTKFITLTGALSGIPPANSKMKMINE